DELRELYVQFLEAARHAHRPAAVTEVSLDLADDVRRRVGRQLYSAVHVEPVDRLDEPDRADLDEVVQLLAAVAVPPRERTHERHVLLDELLAGLEIALFVVATEKNLVVLSHERRPSWSDGRDPHRFGRPRRSTRAHAGGRARRPPRTRSRRGAGASTAR